MQYEPPKHLDVQAKACWREVASELELTKTKAQILAVYCHNRSQYWECEALIKKQGRSVPTERGGVKPNPELAAANQYFDRMMKAAKALGITAVDQPIEPIDMVDEFIKGTK